MTRLGHLACALAIVGLASWEYAAVTRAGFVGEDARWQASVESGRDFYPIGTARSLAAATWRAQQLAGHSALAFHLVDAGLHLLVAALVGVLAWRLGYGAVAAWAAVACAALNAVQVEGVMYLSARPELIAAVGVLTACVIACGRWTMAAGLGVAAAIAVGVGGKESAIVALVLVPLMRQRWALAAAAAVVLAAIMWHFRNIGYDLNTARWTWSIAGAWALQQAAASVRLLGVAVWPWPVRTAIEVDATGVPWLAQVGSLAVLVGGAAAAIAWRREAAGVAIGVCWVAAVIGLRMAMYTPLSGLNAHQFYGATLGVALVVAAVVDGYERKGAAC